MSARNRQKEQARKSRVPHSRTALIYTLLNDRVSRIYTEVPIQLKTKYTQYVYRNAYDSVAEALYRVFEVMPMVAPEVAEKVGLVIENNLEQADRELGEDINKARVMAEESGLNFQASYTVIKEINVRVSTPQGMAYLAMLQKLDELVTLADSLWLVKKIETHEKKDLLMGWRKRLTSLAFETRDLCIETVRKIADQQKMAQKHTQQKEEIRRKRIERHRKIEAQESEVVASEQGTEINSDAEKVKEAAVAG